MRPVTVAWVGVLGQQDRGPWLSHSLDFAYDLLCVSVGHVLEYRVGHYEAPGHIHARQVGESRLVDNRTP